MSFKANFIFIDHRMLTEKKIAETLMEVLKETSKKYLPEQYKHNKNIFNPYGSILFEFTSPHPSGIQILFFDSFENKYTLLIDLVEIVRLLSQKIKDVPFFHFRYSSVVDTGEIEVFKNGESIETSLSSSGDNGIHMTPLLQKYFFIKKDVLGVIRNWFEKVRNNSDFGIFGEAYREYTLEYGNEFMKNFLKIENEGLEIFKRNPKITEKEWLDNGYKRNYFSARSLYMSYLYHVNKAFASKMYLFTLGNAYEKPGVSFLDEPTQIKSYDYHHYKNEVREAYEARKNEVYGEAPPSYKLTADELQHLSYDEQKEEAFKRYSIAKSRREPLLESYFVSGIVPKTPFAPEQYVRYQNTFMRIKKIDFKIDNNKCYRESILLIEMGKNEKTYHNHQAWANHLILVDESDVPEVNRVPIQLIVR